MKRLPYILGITLLALSLAYAISTTLQVESLKREWAECSKQLKEVGDRCILRQSQYGQSVEFVRGGM